MKTFLAIILASIFLITNCTQQPNTVQKEINSVEEIRSFPEVFSNGMDAHGGLEKWNSYGTLKFTELTDKDTTHYTVDLRNRNELIERQGKYKIGFTADDINIYPHRDSFPGENPRFYHNLRFYFFAIAFVTADQGAFQEVLQPAEFNGSMYDRVKITFGDGVGIAPKDQYILWFSQADSTLGLINYSVTYFDESRAETYNAYVFKEWTEVGGLKLPVKMDGYEWENDSLGEFRYSRKFTNISVLKEQPDPEVFTNLSE